MLDFLRGKFPIYIFLHAGICRLFSGNKGVKIKSAVDAIYG